VARWYWTKYLPACWRGCAAITVSNASLVDDVAQRLDFPRERIHIVPYYAAVPADHSSSSATRGLGSSKLSEAYFLTLASHEPRKNLALAINALAELVSRGFRPRLVCAGGHTAYTVELQALAERLGVSELVQWPGYTDRSKTMELLRNATALIFVSLREGYGMPPQEAQALGTATILSDIPCHRAVYDDLSRWHSVDTELRTPPPFVSVDDSAALSQTMQRMIEDHEWRRCICESGLAYQRTFSANATATALRAAFANASSC
jgi:glycosyltransferase involved in cell wall biosynthesis